MAAFFRTDRCCVPARDVVSWLAAAILMALWVCIVLLLRNLAIASLVVVVAIFAWLIVCLGSVFSDLEFGAVGSLPRQ